MDYVEHEPLMVVAISFPMPDHDMANGITVVIWLSYIVLICRWLFVTTCCRQAHTQIESGWIWTLVQRLHFTLLYYSLLGIAQDIPTSTPRNLQPHTPHTQSETLHPWAWLTCDSGFRSMSLNNDSSLSLQMRSRSTWTIIEIYDLLQGKSNGAPTLAKCLCILAMGWNRVRLSQRFGPTVTVLWKKGGVGIGTPCFYSEPEWGMFGDFSPDRKRNILTGPQTWRGQNKLNKGRLHCHCLRHRDRWSSW